MEGCGQILGEERIVLSACHRPTRMLLVIGSLPSRVTSAAANSIPGSWPRKLMACLIKAYPSTPAAGLDSIGLIHCL